MAEREHQGDYDVAVLGATGYTGRLVLAYLNDLPDPVRGRIAVAGRDHSRLQRAVAECCPRLEPSLVTADLHDSASLNALADRARVVLNLAGPYSERGPAVVQACVDRGAHYLDLTGEPLFMRDLVARHHKEAQRRGLRVVPAAGFECLPFDLTTLYAAERLQAKYGVPCERVDLSVQMQVRDPAVTKDTVLSGGTTATLLTLLGSPQGEDLTDPALLLPPGADHDGARARHPRQRGARWDPLSESWATPVYPAPTLCPQVVMRTLALLSEAGAECPFEVSAFTYRDCASLAGLVDGPGQRPAAAAVSAMIGAGMRVAERGAGWQRSLLSKLVRRVGAASGEGPALSLLDRFDYTLAARATGGSHLTVDVAWRARGNPGYLSTAKMVTEAALALAFDDEHLPHRYGVLTTAAALGAGPHMLARLRRAAIDLEVGG